MGFLVWSRDTFTTKAGQNLVFDFAERNDGGGYDAKTGIFHAPVAGLYHFFWNILSYNNTKGCTILFKHNGNIKMRSFIMPSRLHQTPSGSIYLRMNKDDKVYLESGDSGAFIDDDGYSTFGGELIRCWFWQPMTSLDTVNMRLDLVLSQIHSLPDSHITCIYSIRRWWRIIFVKFCSSSVNYSDIKLYA